MPCNEFVFTGALEDAGVAVAVSLSEGLHHSVNLLGFTRQTETPQELSAENRSRSSQWEQIWQSRQRYTASNALQVLHNCFPSLTWGGSEWDFPLWGRFVYYRVPGHYLRDSVFGLKPNRRFTWGPGRGWDQWTHGGQRKPEELWCWSRPWRTATERSRLKMADTEGEKVRRYFKSKHLSPR